MVEERVYDLRSEPVRVIERIVAEVPRVYLASALERAFVRFEVPASAVREGSWPREADGHRFEVSWALLEGLQLQRDQQEWLEVFGEW